MFYHTGLNSPRHIARAGNVGLIKHAVLVLGDLKNETPGTKNNYKDFNSFLTKLCMSLLWI